MKYEVIDQVTKEIISSHTTEQSAIREAELHKSDQWKGYTVTVVAHEVSGSYESHQQVWPTQGECYSN